ncbi:hypothetical protein ACFQ9J_28500 [Streptomyces sp. NPDC056529]|uniref:hypothetical protein n=1 Tax=Streptomyces sp. NPDC056529 TaxID=3345855 RepID=UPI0036891FCA
MSVSEISNRERRWQEPAAVYRLWDAEGNLLYIGSAYEPDVRYREHQKKPWWPEVAQRTEEWHPNRGRAYVEEMKAIASEPSKYNEMGTPGYRTPQTEAIRLRKLLAPLRQRLLTEAEAIGYRTAAEQREQGVPGTEASRAGVLATIEFMEATGLFRDAVKLRRRRLETHGY